MMDYAWISPFALRARSSSASLGVWLAKAMAKIQFDPVSSKQLHHAWLSLVRDWLDYKLNPDFEEPKDFSETLMSLATLGTDQINQEIFQEKTLTPIFVRIFNQFFAALIRHPQLVDIFQEREIVEDIFTTLRKRFLPILSFFPIFSENHLSLKPLIEDPLFSSLEELSRFDREKIEVFSKEFLTQFYLHELRSYLHFGVKNEANQKLILSLMDEIIQDLPRDKCVNILIHLMCTLKSEYSKEKVISLVLQELGGIYLKLSQVIAQLSPPALARELIGQQDKMGGIFREKNKSWNYVHKVLRRSSWKKLRQYLKIPHEPQEAYAGASVGAIYEFDLTEEGQKKFKTTNKVLIKIQRPGLMKLVHQQKERLLGMLSRIELKEDSDTAQIETEILPKNHLAAFKKAVINYAQQTLEELDFRYEEKNARKIKLSFDKKDSLFFPEYYHVESDVLLMKKMKGEKITSVSPVLGRSAASVSDALIENYLYLMFKDGIIWADPHPGNILYEVMEKKIVLIDLSPCFFWEEKLRKDFINFLHLMFFRQEKALIECLKDLVESPEDLESKKIQNLIHFQLNAEKESTVWEYLLKFSQLLGLLNVHLKPEILAAIRGLSQIYITANAISSKNHFFTLLHRLFGKKILYHHLMSVGPSGVMKSLLASLANHSPFNPINPPGPYLNSRDQKALEEMLTELSEEKIVNIKLYPRIMREVNFSAPYLDFHPDRGIYYSLEIPISSSSFFHTRPLKLLPVAFALAQIECLEELHWHSINEFMPLLEGWNKPKRQRSWKEEAMIKRINVAARKIVRHRFSDLWESKYRKVSTKDKYLWKFYLSLMIQWEKIKGDLAISQSAIIENNSAFSLRRIFLYLKLMIYGFILNRVEFTIGQKNPQLSISSLSTEELIGRLIYLFKKN